VNPLRPASRSACSVRGGLSRLLKATATRRPPQTNNNSIPPKTILKITTINLVEELLFVRWAAAGEEAVGDAIGMA